ncbi:MAG TPA: hypothetical protein VGC56_05695 [Allosphingosinicella sp.]|jgi:hypothetical protein
MISPMNIILIAFLAAQVGAATTPNSRSYPAGVGRCQTDRAQLLMLSQREFDQNLRGGWRELAARPGCEVFAADLIRDYRAAHGVSDGILFWHEGQLRAEGGQTAEAILLFERSRKGLDDAFGWNAYVDATIAFLRRDRRALLAAREALARTPRPVDFNPHDPEGRPLHIGWPPNFEAVDGLVRCFGRTYSEAYGVTCRPANNHVSRPKRYVSRRH